jgi:hypothetical protein
MTDEDIKMNILESLKDFNPKPESIPSFDSVVSEHEMNELLAKMLKMDGFKVIKKNGTPVDIIGDTFAIECKRELTTSTLYTLLGQTLVCKKIHPTKQVIALVYEEVKQVPTEYLEVFKENNIDLVIKNLDLAKITKSYPTLQTPDYYRDTKGNLITIPANSNCVTQTKRTYDITYDGKVLKDLALLSYDEQFEMSKMARTEVQNVASNN